MDAALMFDVLMYLNMYYYPIYSVPASIISISKYRSIIDTPNIGRDASVQGSLLVVELLKLILFRKLRDHRVWAVSVATVLASASIAALLYIFILQNPVLKAEYILCSILLALVVSQFVYGVLSFLPCCKKQEYY